MKSPARAARTYSRKSPAAPAVASAMPAPPPCAPAALPEAQPANDAQGVGRLKRVWSAFQQAIFVDAAEGEGDTVVQARAGTGKTTTILETLRHVPAAVRGTPERPGVLLCAFNKSIKEEISIRVDREGITGVEVSTLHGFGFGALRYAFRGIQIDNRKADRLIVARMGDAPERQEYRSNVKRGLGLAKGMLAETADDVLSIVDAFDLDVADAERATFAADVLAIMAQCKLDTRACDFDDMIWMPVTHRLRTKQYARVFVDETQDLNRAQIALVKMARRPGGRICAVGDDRQAIYGFRGADSQAMPGLIAELGAKVLPLSVTYRCARSIVALAAEIVPDYQAAPEAPEGEVLPATLDQLRNEAQPGDFVLSRTNAPIVGLCLAFLMKGIPASVAGRDIGEGLVSLIEKSKARTLEALATWIDDWSDREVNRRRARNREVDTQDITDRAECIHKLSEGKSTVAELIASVRSLFSDADDQNRIILSTVHKAKGLERDRAWLLRDTFKPSRGVEEANLYYVAITRARTSLRMVSKVK